MRPAIARLAAMLAALASAAAGAQAPFSFAVLGDSPYRDFEEVQLAATLTALGREPLAFVIHVGDLKSGAAPCTDALMAQRLALLDASPLPLVFTPGDNDWTDCHGARAGRHDPLERLQHLRELFFARDESLGRRRIALTRQPGRPENVRWSYGGVVFVTLNVPGSNNNARMPAERDARMADNGAWLDAAARTAAEGDARALVVVGHAEPGFGRGPLRDDAYAGYRAALAAVAVRLGKPMLLVNGDDHLYAFDRPFADPRTGRRIERFHRVSPYGSPAMAPAIVTVNPALPQLFEARSGLAP